MESFAKDLFFIKELWPNKVNTAKVNTAKVDVGKMNIEKVRENTPACLERIHFNNAGSSLMPLSVTKVMAQFTELEASKGGYYAQEACQENINEIYTSIAKLINCEAKEVALCESSTVAWQKVLLSLKFNPGDEIITTRSEYSSNYMFLLKLQKDKGIKLIVIDEDTNNDLELADIELKITSKTKLISITHMPTGNGVVHPIEAIGKIAKKHNLLYIVDACQSAGQYPLDVSKIQCDFLTASGRKFLRAPRGTGFLYVATDKLKSLDPAFIDLRSADWQSPSVFKRKDTAIIFETWEKSFSNYLGLGQAVNVANTLGLENIWERVSENSKALRQGLETITEVQNQDNAKTLSGIVTFIVDGQASPKDLVDYLKSKNISIGVTKREFTQLEFESRKFNFVFRASVHYFNTKKEIESFVLALKAYLKDLEG